MDHTREGWEHFAAAEWAAGRDSFAAALAAEPDDPEALDGLGQSLWWLGERNEAIERRRQAYAEFQRRGETRRAGGLAAYLAGESRIDGRSASADGWMARARRLLGDAGPCSEQGWLMIEEAKRAANPAASEEHGRAALAIAHEISDPNIECMALAQVGHAVVRQGRVEEGLALLDEAMTVALGGESQDPLACGDACCTTLLVCESLADLDRAAEWCASVVDFAERRRFTPVQSWCRGIYGTVLVRAGEWERAEAVLTEALSRRADRRRGASRVLPLTVLADLRLRQGRTEDAERLLEGLGGQPDALAPLVRLHLARGEPDLAAALLERPDQAGPESGELIALRGWVAIAAGEREAAAGLAESLVVVAVASSRPDLDAEADLLAGSALLLAGKPEAAQRSLAQAASAFATVALPLEEGRARLALARAQAGAGSPLAVATAREARDTFEKLGARNDADAAAAFLREQGAGGRTGGRGERGDLTGREREVLELLVAGLSNAEIGERLFITPKTVEHHVSRVLAKLGVRSRAEAAAHAVRDGF